MPTFLYRCPNTGLRVQGWIANAPAARDKDRFEAVTCPACARVHLVNPQTGKVLGSDDKGLTFAIARRDGLRIISIARNRPAAAAFGANGSSILRQLLNKVEEYRRNAAECMRLAARVAAPNHRRLLLALAQRWLHLAEWRARLQAQEGDADAGVSARS